jgi:4-amino-4-deoxy-L-arabinose transferase-like glycosyltransferase
MGRKRNTRPEADPMVEQRSARRRTAERALQVAAALAFVALRIPYLELPLERDEGNYAYVAWRILEGEAPYRDVFDQKPPGIYAVYAALLALGARSEVSLHLLLYAWTAACALCLFRLVRDLAGGLAAGFCVLLFAVLANGPRLTATAANTESFLLLPLLASWWALWRATREGRAADWCAAGALAAAACWLKPVAATNALFAAVWAGADWAVRRPRPAAGDLVRRLGWLAAGAAAVSALSVAALAALGSLGAFFEIVILHNWDYSLQHTAGEGLAILGHVLAFQAPSQALLWVGAAAGLFARRAAPARVRLFFAGQLAAAALGAAIGLHFRPHYFVPLLPALCALAGIAGAAAAERLLAARRAATAALGVAALGALALVPVVAGDAEFLFAGSPAAAARRLYGLNPFPESARIAEHIASRSGPGDTVLVVGSEPQILFAAERRSATRYILFYPLTGPFPDALARQREAMREVEESDPLYVVWVDVATSLLFDERSERWIFEEASRRLRRDYRIELVVHPTRDLEGYVFASGAQAQRWLDWVKSERPEVPWVGVYRRRMR